MRLIPASKVASFIGFEEGVNSSEIEQATDSASEQIIALLGTELDAVVGRVDTFYVPPSMSLRQADNIYRTRLALSRGFLTSLPVARMGLVYPSIETDGELLGAETMAVNMQKGELVLSGADMNGMYVRVMYDAGYEVTDGEFDVDALPNWLVQATILQAVILLDSMHPKMRMESGADKSVAQLNKTLAAILTSKQRYFPSAVHPIV